MITNSGVQDLQEYWDRIRKKHHHEYEIRWVPSKGYYAYPASPIERHFLGSTIEEAKKTLTFYSEV